MMGSVLALLLMSAQAEPAEEPQADEVQTAEARAEDDVVCRRRRDPGNGIGDRGRTVRVCKTKEEWERDRFRRR